MLSAPEVEEEGEEKGAGGRDGRRDRRREVESLRHEAAPEVKKHFDGDHELERAA